SCMVSSLARWIVSATSILAHYDADLEWGGDHPISEGKTKDLRKPGNFSFLFFPWSSVDSVANQVLDFKPPIAEHHYRTIIQAAQNGTTPGQPHPHWVRSVNRASHHHQTEPTVPLLLRTPR
ncbi:hypothetical protein ACFOZ5_13450, partial [Marinobacter lacisalsi]